MKEALQKKIDLKTKPLGSLGKLEKIALQIGMIQNTLNPVLRKPTHIVFAADHGLVEAGVSAYPKEVTFQMVMNFLQGGAAINVFCRQHGIDLKVADAGVDFEFKPDAQLIHAKVARGTANILEEPAMSVSTCHKAMKKGAKIVDTEYLAGCNVISFGEMGIGNTSSAALLMHAFSGLPIEQCTGRGTGHDDAGLKKKIAILKDAAAKYHVTDPIGVLSTFGGLEIAMMVGAMIEAKKHRMLILVDGFISTAALLTVFMMDESILDFCIFCHQSDESGHKYMLDYLEVEPLINLGMRLGEGTGAVVAYPIIESAVLFLNEMASFKDAGISKK